jgi:hypothetical protein
MKNSLVTRYLNVEEREDVSWNIIPFLFTSLYSGNYS